MQCKHHIVVYTKSFKPRWIVLHMMAGEPVPDCLPVVSISTRVIPSRRQRGTFLQKGYTKHGTERPFWKKIFDTFHFILIQIIIKMIK